MENKIDTENAIVQIMNSEYQTFKTIGTWPSCEHELRDLTIEFLNKVKSHYENKKNDKYN